MEDTAPIRNHSINMNRAINSFSFETLYGRFSILTG
mgnify:CR=1 FL=1